jgi:MoaA/NifB/PqqE/SkfB family radical SAM enzyme
MKFETVEDIFLQAEKLGVKEIIPSTMGEPLMYKGIEGIFELSQKHGIKINLTTNGTFPKLKVEQWANLIVPNTTDVKISWNGATAETAEKVMKGIELQSSFRKSKRVHCVPQQTLY